ncbi:MAG: hypothetical protein ACREV3_01670 [Gammaproteobacteria bacterium]
MVSIMDGPLSLMDGRLSLVVPAATAGASFVVPAPIAPVLEESILSMVATPV